MELQFRSDTCRCLTAAIREIRNTELTQEVRLNDGLPDIASCDDRWMQREIDRDAPPPVNSYHNKVKQQ